MNQKNYLVAGVVVLLIIAGLAVYYYLTKTAPAPITAPAPANPFGESVSNPLTGAVNCAEKADQGSKDACWQSQAVARKDATLCDNIKTSNPFVSRDTCLNLTASASRDSKICGLIKNPAIKTNCLNNTVAAPGGPTKKSTGDGTSNY